MSGNDPRNDPPGKHATARTLADEALRLRNDGDDAEAERLLDQATRTDPEATADALQDAGANAPGDDDFDPATADEEVARISRTLQPGSDAPSRAGITGSGSGADTEER